MTAENPLARADFDEDALFAAFDLAHRAGAKSIELGYHEDDPKPDALNWYADCALKGTRIIAEGVGPVEAAEALGRKLLRGGTCRRCGEPIMLGGPKVARGCRWTRRGKRWEPGCGKPIDSSIPAPLAPASQNPSGGDA